MAPNYNWLIPLIPGGLWTTKTELLCAAGTCPGGEGEAQYQTVTVPATSFPGVPEYDGEGNFVRFHPYWYQSVGAQYLLSPNDWAIQKAISMGMMNPNGYDWIILGEYALPGRREWIFDQLRTVGASIGMPPDYDWTDALAYAARLHWEQFAQPFRWLESPAIAPVHSALAYASNEFPNLAPYVEQTGPGSEIWNITLAAANQRRDAHDDVVKSLKVIAVVAIAAMVVAPYFIGAEGAAGAGASATSAGTATVQGAELAALVESGTVGVQGAFLEAAALTGSTVTYSTATGAVIQAVTPAGTVLNFDPSVDAFAQFGVEPAQIAEAVQLPEPVEIPEPVETMPEVQSTQSNSYADKLKQSVQKMAESQIKAAVVNELRDAFTDDPAAPRPVAQQPKMGDSTPVFALALLAGAAVVRKMRK